MKKENEFDQTISSKDGEAFEFNTLNIQSEIDLWVELNRKPAPHHIRYRNIAPRGKPENLHPYLPISYIEAKLRQIFGPMGMQITGGHWSVVINETVGRIVVKLRHPIEKDWRDYEGWAATQIQMKSGAAVLDAASKYTSSQEKMHPSLKSRCISDAVKVLGPALGGNLGRKADQVESLSKEMAHEVLNDILTNIEFASTREELQAAKAKIPVSYFDLAPVRKSILEADNRFSKNQLPEQAEAQTLFGGQ